MRSARLARCRRRWDTLLHDTAVSRDDEAQCDRRRSAAAVPAVQGPRSRIAKMSAEVVDDNPYSRLMALQRMGIVKDYERIREKTVGSSHSWNSHASIFQRPSGE
jgi:hypothetical protein